jgi:hypothetical protein
MWRIVAEHCSCRLLRHVTYRRYFPALYVTNIGVKSAGPGHPLTMMVTTEHVRELLAADTDATLVVIEGRAQVVSAADLESDAVHGALEVITRRELLDRVGDGDLDDSAIAAQAAALDTEVSELGG